MNLESQQTLLVSQQQAWDALNDIDLLRSIIPGCESISPIGENHFEVLLVAAIGPVRAKFKGELKLADMNPPESYALHFEGKGGAAGHGKGSATVRLETESAEKTILHYSASATVGGKLAQVGSRLVDAAAQKMAGEFFDKFNAALMERYHPAEVQAEEANEEAARPSRWARLLGR
jgi:uncharacterized protein